MASETKKLESKRKLELKKTCGGPFLAKELTDMQQQIVSIIGETAISGIEVFIN